MTIKEKILNTNVDQIGVCNRYVDGDVVVYAPNEGRGHAIGKLNGDLNYSIKLIRWQCQDLNFAFPEKGLRFATQEEKELLGESKHVRLNDIPEPTITLNKYEYEKTYGKLNDQALELIGENDALQIEINCLKSKITQIKNTHEEAAKSITELYDSLLKANIRIEELEEEVDQEQELAKTAELLIVQIKTLNLENIELSNKLNTINHISKNKYNE